MPTNYNNEQSDSRFESACKPLGKFLKNVASKSDIISGDFNLSITNTMSPRSQIFWGCVLPNYCVWPKYDTFSYIGPFSSNFTLDHGVASFGSQEIIFL